MGGWGPRKCPEYYFELSRSAFAAGRPAEAEHSLRHAVCTAPPGSSKRVRARALLGLSLLKQGRTTEASAECDRLRSELASVRGLGASEAQELEEWVREASGFNKGLVQDIAGMHTAAVDTFTAAAAASNCNIDALLGRALALRSLRRYREAARDYISVLGSSAGPDGPAPVLPWSRRSESKPVSPEAAEASSPQEPRAAAGGGGGSGPALLGRCQDAELLRLLRRPAAARSEDQVLLVAGLLAEVSFFRYPTRSRPRLSRPRSRSQALLQLAARPTPTLLLLVLLKPAPRRGEPLVLIERATD
jgi:tetratricopeptide (TPR) repeat protein